MRLLITHCKLSHLECLPSAEVGFITASVLMCSCTFIDQIYLGNALCSRSEEQNTLLSNIVYVDIETSLLHLSPMTLYFHIQFLQ